MDVDRKIELGLTAAITFATIVNVGIAIVNACVASKQWEAMQETNQISLRPIVAIELRPSTFRFETNEKGQHRGPIIEFYLTNSGKLPAYAHTATGLIWGAKNRPIPAELMPPPEPGAGIESNFLFAGNPTNLATWGPIYSGEDLAILNSSKSEGRKAYFSVRVMYGPGSDIGKYVTRVCNAYDIVGGDNERLVLQGGEPCPGGEKTNYAK